VNETFVKQIFNGANPLGHRIGFGKDGALDTEIVGVVKDSHYSPLRIGGVPLPETDPPAQMLHADRRLTVWGGAMRCQ